MANSRHYRPRCSKCLKANEIKYRLKQVTKEVWENVLVIRLTTGGAYLKCKNCGHEWYSGSKAIRSMTE